MKRFAYFLTAALVVCGCQLTEMKEDISTTNPSGKAFTAIIEEVAPLQSRTSLDEDGNVLWKRGDRISIFEGSTINEQYQVADESDGKTSTSLEKVSPSGFVAGSEIDNNVAFYPYASSTTIARSGDSYVIRDIVLPATQVYSAGSFGNGAFPMAAVTESPDDLKLKFKNVLGGLKLQLKGTATIASITVKGNRGEILCGEAEVTVAYGTVPSLTLTDASAQSVVLACGSGVALNPETATPFVIALPPMTMDEGFTVLVKDTEGKTMEISTTKSQTINRSRLLKMPIVDYVGTTPYLNEPFTITSIGSTSVAIVQVGTPDPVSLEYRISQGDWTTYSIGTAIELSDGESVQFQAGEGGNVYFSKSTTGYYKVTVDGVGSVEASGNIMSLLDASMQSDTLPRYAFADLFIQCRKLVSASNLNLPATTLAYGCYNNMFLGCTDLISAPALPATTLAMYCYSCMFANCTGLTSAPELPATVLASNCYYCMFTECTSLKVVPNLPATTLTESCYGYMFKGCTGLSSAPELPATRLADFCYYSMFSGCTGLTAAPELPATTLTVSCYDGMFSGCTGLTAAPELPATTLAQQCYLNMFSGCTGLTAAPALPAASLAYSCYSGMFKGCTGLSSAPELPSATLEEYCYNGMFSGCTGLSSAPALPATKMAGRCYLEMFKDCTGLTSAPELPATTLAMDCYCRMFYGCSGLTTAPELPATKLASGCYGQMFIGCTRMTTAPELPATTLSSYCYAEMFYRCENLSYIKMLATVVSASDCLRDWVSGVASSGTFVKSAAATLPTGKSGIPNGWTVLTD